MGVQVVSAVLTAPLPPPSTPQRSLAEKNIICMHEFLSGTMDQLWPAFESILNAQIAR